MIPAQALQNLIEEGDRLIGNRHSENCGSRYMGDCNCHVMKWHEVKARLREAFEEEEKALPEILARSLEIKGDRILDPHYPAVQIKWSTNGDTEGAAKDILHRIKAPIVMRKQDIDDVLSRMYNWKMRSAFSKASSTMGFPPKALEILKDLSEKFGNCGWQDGAIFDSLREGNNKVADILGYEWNDEKDMFIKKTTAE